VLKTKRILALDIGASKLTLAEFGRSSEGGPELLRYGFEALPVGPESENDPAPFIAQAVREIMRREGMRPAPLYMSVSGQAVFPRYVKLPPVTRDKVLQIIRYEAEQNVPFPIDEVVWDYQLVEGGGAGELNVMLVAVKTERVAALTDGVEEADLDPVVVDVAPMALYNAVRYNYPDLPGCTMILDIGARCSNVIFVEDCRIFSRSIPVAGNVMTQEIAKEFELDFDEAETLKQEQAFVAFGGVYASADDEVADRVSKILRTVVTRLHAEVNRSINFYRSQQGGNAPSLVLLTGGSSVIPHTDTFFREKLKVPVEYLNPFNLVSVQADIPAEQVAQDAHVLGEVAGLALRRLLVCPVEINLIPPHLEARKTFRRRQPFFALAAVGIVLVLLSWWGYFQRMREAVTVKKQTVKLKIDTQEQLVRQLGEARRARELAAARADRLADVAAMRARWVDIVSTIHEQLAPGMWLSSLRSEASGGKVVAISIAGRGFLDRVEESAAIDAMRDRLIATGLFTDRSKITHLPGVTSRDYARSFALKLVLARPLELDPSASSGEEAAR
jgi:type IV pilus assembly protein PilM